MIHHLQGNLTEVNPAFAVVECGGVGYLVNITLTTYSHISSLSEVKLYTLPIYKEDAQTLFGFYDRIEKEIFSLLISVSGVGGNTARVILSSLSAEEVQDCIASENVGLLKSVKGIGAKTAQRIIVDLKDKVSNIGLGEGGRPLSAGASDVIPEASSALEVLGYATRQTHKLLHQIKKENPSISLEEMIKTALKRL
ncbi:MAG TPA: Holliday junction branch migration protein RuvA [Cryomorphaceae bacterium]|nr:Holliday junction branch migration protein RuvA [Owenweeksia sp.]MBF99881.1 Holliday junction branch migration protein RuvA [Owenweeksia sp.]HAD97683.1 Holliday junction branch migration protein RuvA [Cryomorphaceae bacterium]HCQ16790.1 Holliday junction branch migration protein RuvA [Cryomorphaceae bacterium]|tara:strand:- start:130 stop:717 length:588 start_codon:yes stop_codon:yes gene_type:complete